MKKIILHVSNTNLDWDYRILRAMECASEVEGFKVVGLGLKFDEGAVHARHNFDILNLALLASKIKRISPFKTLRAGLVYFEFILRIILKIIKIRPTLVHCHDAPALLPVIISRMFVDFKIIYDAHELMSQKAGNTWLSSKIFYSIEYLSWNKLNLFITVSNEINNWYQDTFGKKESLIVHNAPMIKKYDNIKYEQKYFEDKFKIPQNAKKYVFVGQFIPGRSIEYISEVFTELPTDYHIVFVGYGELENYLKELSQTNRNLHIHHALPHDELVDFLKYFDVGICLIEQASLSDYYSLPNKLFEYLSADLKIIASDLPEIRRVIHETQSGWILSNHSQGLNDLILSIPHESITSKNNADHYLWESQKNGLRAQYITALKN
jgi:glycosyltransferase involved in cell wall biosynthesis